MRARSLVFGTALLLLLVETASYAQRGGSRSGRSRSEITTRRGLGESYRPAEGRIIQRNQQIGEARERVEIEYGREPALAETVTSEYLFTRQPDAEITAMSESTNRNRYEANSRLSEAERIEVRTQLASENEQVISIRSSIEETLEIVEATGNFNDPQAYSLIAFGDTVSSWFPGILTECPACAANAVEFFEVVLTETEIAARETPELALAEGVRQASEIMNVTDAFERDGEEPAACRGSLTPFFN